MCAHIVQRNFLCIKCSRLLIIRLVVLSVEAMPIQWDPFSLCIVCICICEYVARITNFLIGFLCSREECATAEVTVKCFMQYIEWRNQRTKIQCALCEWALSFNKKQHMNCFAKHLHSVCTMSECPIGLTVYSAKSLFSRAWAHTNISRSVFMWCGYFALFCVESFLHFYPFQSWSFSLQFAPLDFFLFFFFYLKMCVLLFVKFDRILCCIFVSLVVYLSFFSCSLFGCDT